MSMIRKVVQIGPDLGLYINASLDGCLLYVLSSPVVVFAMTSI